MFTRLKTLSLIVFFFLSFLAITLVWGENGIKERRVLALQAEEKEKETLEREARIALLRERNTTEKEKDGGEYRLVASFSDEGRLYSANTTEEKDNVSEMEFEGLEMWKCLLWAIVSTFALWVLECFLFPILTKTIGKRTTENGSNN